MTEELRQKLLHSAEGPGAEPFSQYNHMKVTAVDDGTATVELELHPDSLNCWGTPHGGALFTVGGSNTDGTAHAYNVADMQGTLYQQMLPVLATNYVPPIGLMVIIDRSGSMGGEKLEAARTGADLS